MLIASLQPDRVAKEEMPICAVVVTFRADASVVDNIQALSRECGVVIAVDNGSGDDSLSQISAIPGVQMIRSGRNLGLAAALNTGLDRARAIGFKWAITFDQDSTPEIGFARAIWATHLNYLDAALVVPQIVERTVGVSSYFWLRKSRRWPFLFERAPCQENDLPSVTIAITSGALTDLSVWAELGRFEEGLFIDYIDVDYCLRVRKAGKHIAVSAGAMLRHQLGERRAQRFLGYDFRPTFHAAFRHFYISRNRVFVWRRHALREPHWALFDLCYAAYNMVRVIIFENNRWKKVKAFALGLSDGLRDKYGPLADGRL